MRSCVWRRTGKDQILKMNAKKSRIRIAELKDLHLYLVLSVICLLSRVPFLKTIELVTYDGTYYLNQAKTLLSGDMSGAFPIGYPLVVAVFRVFLRNYELAGQTVSFLAGVGSTIVLYLIACRFVRRELAFLGATLLALNPLFVRLSLMTMSESLYIFWVLLGILLFIRERDVLFGAVIGAAAITRPEALAIAGLLWLARLKKPKRMVLIAVSFLAVYAVNVAILSANFDRLVILPKSGAFGVSVSYWKTREASIDFADKNETLEKLQSETEQKSVFADYIDRLPREALLLGRHVLPVIFLLALISMRRRENLVLLTALASFFIYPLATVRTDDRFILPYIPILILLAVSTLDSRDLRNKKLRAAAITGLLVTLVVLPVVNRAQLLEPEEPNLMAAKTAALAFRPQVKPNDKIASRKPFFAYYTGGKYVPIPVAPYEDLMRYLGKENIKFLALHQPTIHNLRPVLRPLLYDYMTINGELRYRQSYFDPAGVIVYTRERDSDPLEWTRLTQPASGSALTPAWSPDGRKIAVRSRSAGESGGIYVVALGERPSGRGFSQKIAEAPLIDDQLSWSPDARYIAYANKTGSETDIYTVELTTGNIRQITDGRGNNQSPSWSPNGKEIAFSSERSGQKEIWMVNLDRGEFVQLTGDGNNARPVFSPSGGKLAWIKKGRGVAILHRQQAKILQLGAPAKIDFAPAWSPDESYIAVTAEDWGSWDVYLLKSDGSGALLLTKKKPGREAMPAWSPDGRSLAVVSDRGEKTMSIWAVGNLDIYIERLENPPAIQTFKHPSIPSE